MIKKGDQEDDRAYCNVRPVVSWATRRNPPAGSPTEFRFALHHNSSPDRQRSCSRLGTTVGCEGKSNNFQQVTAVLEILIPMETKANPNTHNRKNYTERNQFHTENEREKKDVRFNIKKLDKTSFNFMLLDEVFSESVHLART